MVCHQPYTNWITELTSLDQSLWLTEGLEGGFGGDWGQQVGSEYFLQNLDSDSIHIFLHELGHTFALDGTFPLHPPYLMDSC